MNCSGGQIPPNKSLSKSLFNQVGRVNLTSRKSLEIQAFFITKPRTHSEQKFV